MSRKLIVLFGILSLSNVVFGQIEIKITKIGVDSFNVELPQHPNLEMGKKYQFIIKTNITDRDSLFENLNSEKIEDGKMIDYTFNYHEFGFDIYSLDKKRVKKIIKSEVFYIRGTRYLVKIDGKSVSRLHPNIVGPNSKIDIELISETFDRKDFKINDPIILYWMNNQNVYKKYKLLNYGSIINLTTEDSFKSGLKSDQKFNYVILLLPQVSYKGNNILPDEQKERMYIMMYKN